MGLCFSIFKFRRSKTRVRLFDLNDSDDKNNNCDVTHSHLTLADLECSREPTGREPSEVTVLSWRHRLRQHLRASEVDPLARVPASVRRRLHTTSGVVRQRSQFFLRLQRGASTRTSRSFPVSAYRSRAFSMQQSRDSTSRRRPTPSRLTAFNMRVRGKLKRCSPSPLKDERSPYAQILAKSRTGACLSSSF